MFVESNYCEQRDITRTHAHVKMACSVIVRFRGWHSWHRQNTLGTIFLLLCQSQPTLITFKFTKLYWQHERSHCCSPTCWETKYNADLSQGSGFPVAPVQVRFNVKCEKCARKNTTLFSVTPFLRVSGLHQKTRTSVRTSRFISYKSACLIQLLYEGCHVIPRKTPWRGKQILFQ